MYTQWLAENFNDEANVLMAFYKFIQNFDTIIHFNGNAFDIPFVKERGEKYKLEFNFDKFKSIDIYKPVSKLNHILKMENQKQKTFEQILGIKRRDPFSGGDLIEVFKHFAESKDERLIFSLLLHNREDIINMGKLISLLSVSDLFNNKLFSISKFDFNGYSDINGDIQKELRIDLSLNNPIPFSLSYNCRSIHFAADKNRAVITVDVIQGTFKYFFNNPKDYYYLPLEDKAIHKSISAFVDRQFRKQATASTCYEKFSGDFLPICNLDNPLFKHTLKEDYKSKTALIKTDTITDKTIYAYACEIIEFIKHNGK